MHPESARAARRVAAETMLREFGRQTRVNVSILRAPGIYAADRLPLERVKRGDPVLNAEEDSYSNHIHADDLANAVVLALIHGRSNRAYNATDDSAMKMGDWFTHLADAFDLPAPPRVDRATAEEQLSPALLSFLRESRRLSNGRIKRELGLKLTYPTVEAGVAAARQPVPAQVVATPPETETPPKARNKPKTTAKAKPAAGTKAGVKASRQRRSSGHAAKRFNCRSFSTWPPARPDHALDKGLSHHLRGQLVRRPVLPAAYFREPCHGSSRQHRRARAAVADGGQAVSLHQSAVRPRHPLWCLAMAGLRFSGGWLHAKLALVVGLIGYYHYCGKLLRDFVAGRNTRTHVWYRVFNEIPVFALFAIVILVVVKPF